MDWRSSARKMVTRSSACAPTSLLPIFATLPTYTGLVGTVGSFKHCRKPLRHHGSQRLTSTTRSPHLLALVGLLFRKFADLRATPISEIEC